MPRLCPGSSNKSASKQYRAKLKHGKRSARSLARLSNSSRKSSHIRILGRTTTSNGRFVPAPKGLLVLVPVKRGFVSMVSNSMRAYWANLYSRESGLHRNSDAKTLFCWLHFMRRKRTARPFDPLMNRFTKGGWVGSSHNKNRC